MTEDLEEIFMGGGLDKKDVRERVGFLMEELELPYVIVGTARYDLSQTNNIPEEHLARLYEELCMDYEELRSKEK